MIGKRIEFKDKNLKDCKGKILDKVLSLTELSNDFMAITKYLVEVKPDKNLILVKPNQIKKVL